ncbi:prolipoprotein diacylglyceryl transferase family protein [Roseisolibacter sp. H3M3-2]|uniref:prolipoprotein diacylglyceryl transferase n=1 Tax=Roseisolibacter sp. H3M3-2 TaxID=3031323 RepID=UPI0023DB2A82|nr:prolipoprotein diacylglyceryl transferase family protein [Roseisolibacter sp. H3M3-2]MDF1503874.1 prolipoprotein diacylglyceryl transferase [Roseisolibacter sp. H3M3-2]
MLFPRRWTLDARPLPFMMLAAPYVHAPFSIDIGPLQLTGFGLAVLAAFWLSQVVVMRELTRRGHDLYSQTTPDVVFAALLGFLIGAKLYFVVLTGDPGAIFSRGGFVFWGGFMGSVALCFLTIKRKKLSFARYADVAGIAIAGGYAVGRTGCFAVGDDYGRPWGGPLAFTFPQGAPPSTAANMRDLFGIQMPAGTSPAEVIAVHPTQLYETAMGFVMFLILWRLRDHAHAEGWLFGVYCVLAGVERFIVEFFRAKDDQLIVGLTSAQIIAIAIAVIGVVVMIVRRTPGPGAPGIHAGTGGGTTPRAAAAPA